MPDTVKPVVIHEWSQVLTFDPAVAGVQGVVRVVPLWRRDGCNIRAAPQNAVRIGAWGHALPVDRIALGGLETLHLARRQIKVEVVPEVGTSLVETTSRPFFPNPRRLCGSSLYNLFFQDFVSLF